MLNALLSRIHLTEPTTTTHQTFLHHHPLQPHSLSITLLQPLLPHVQIPAHLIPQIAPTPTAHPEFSLLLNKENGELRAYVSIVMNHIAVLMLQKPNYGHPGLPLSYTTN